MKGVRENEWVRGGTVNRALAAVRTNRWYGPLGRSPILLWRAGLGPLMGLLFAVLTTRGRKTGRPYPNLITHREADGRRFVLGLYGRKSHWYRNLEAEPRVTFQTASGARSMLAYPLTDAPELVEAYRVLRGSSPIVFRFYLWSLGIADSEVDLLANHDRTMIVELRPTDAETPPPVRVDLLWVWPAALAGWLVWRRIRRRG